MTKGYGTMTSSRTRYQRCNRWSIKSIGNCFLQCFCLLLIIEIFVFSRQARVHHETEDKDAKIKLSDIVHINELSTGATNIYKAKLEKAWSEQKNNPVFKGISLKKDFFYPLEIDINQLAHDIMSNKSVNVTIINPHPYKFTVLPHNKCNFRNQNRTVVILVKSAISNSERRKSIRKTWGNLTGHSNVDIVFMLGMGRNATDNDISSEIKEHKDIIQENFIDAYRNNTIKTIMGFNWAVKYCRKANYLFFVDDDYFVNIKNLLNVPNRFRLKPNVYGGTITGHAVPFRDKDSKWYISWEDYPYDRWPPYIMGGAYIVSMTTATQFHAVFPYIKSLFMDDAYLGIVAKKLHITPSGLPHFYSGHKKRKMMKTMIASHGYDDPIDVMFMWNHINSKDIKGKT